MKKRLTIGRSLIEIICAVFILLFLYTALSKTQDIHNTKNVLVKTPGLSNFALEIAWTIVIMEYILTILLFFPRTKKAGLIASLSLMIIFTVFISYMKLFVPNLPCSCGGVVSQLNWNEHMVFNVCFILLAILGLLLMRKNQNEPSGEETVPIIFT